jgi:hypothetical protein
MIVLRRLAFPFGLVGARLRAGGSRLALVALGVVAGSAVLAAVLGGRLVMQDRALAQALAQLQPADRTVQVAWDGTDAQVWPSLDRLVAPRLQTLTGHPPARAMLFREASIQGRLVNLRAADDLGRYVHLVSGRLPAICRPSHCEVLRLEGKGPIPSTPKLRLIEVGHAVLDPDAPFAPFVLPAPRTEEIAQAIRYHTPQPSPIVIANGVAGLARNAELGTFYRSYAWFVPTGGDDIHPWSLGAFTRKVQAVTADLEARSDLIQVTAPTEQLGQAATASSAAARRLLLLGGEGGALLLAFTILAAAALRRDASDARRRLVFFGARRWQVELFTLVEAATLAALGTLVGWICGAGIAAFVAGRAGSPAGQVALHALLSTGGILAALGTAAAAAGLLYATVRSPALQLGRVALTPLDAAALGAVAIVAVGWARGSIGAGQLASGGTGAFLLLVPALIVFAAAVGAARLLSPVLRGVERLGRRGPIAFRLAANSLARNPGHAAIAATFLVASLGLALFAVAYRSTLERGQQDEAAYAVPASFVLAEDLSQLVPVLHGAPLSAYPSAPLQVLRLSGNVPSGTTFSFLGLPSSKVQDTGGWRSDFASQPLGSLAARLAPRTDESLRTLSLPAGRHFLLPVTTRGDDVGVRALFRSLGGDYETVSLGRTRGSRRVLLHGRTPFVHSTLAQIELDLINGGRLNANGGVGLQPSAKGLLSLGTPTVNGRPVADAFAGWLGQGGVSFDGGARIGYVLTPDQRGTFRPLQPTDGHSLPVLATPAVAAEAGPRGLLPLQVEGEQIAARVVGVVERFPSVVGDAVVADRQTASTVLDTRSPGLGITDELWLNVPASRLTATAAALRRAPFTALTVTSRATVAAGLRNDPLARGALLTLADTAAVALALALVGLLLAVVGDTRDERGELFDLEAQGAAPGTIRTHLRLRALLVASFGLAGGIALGAVLSALVISLVAVTASAAEPEPPLRLSLDLPLLGLAAAGYLVVAAALVAFATRTRGTAPARAAETAA